MTSRRSISATKEQSPSTARPWTVETAFEQLEQCDYRCEGGPLKMNDAYVWLKRHLAQEQGAELQAISEAVTEMRLGAGALMATGQHARAEQLLRYADALKNAVLPALAS